MCWKTSCKKIKEYSNTSFGKQLKMSWFFKLVFLGITWSAIHTEEIISSESLLFPKEKVIETFFKSSFENASYRETFDDGRLRLQGAKEKPQEDLSYRHHGSHPANGKSWKLQCVWNAMNNLARRQSKLDSTSNKTKTLPAVRELCNSHAWEDCGVDFNDAFCEINAEYRSIDGTCNNIVNTKWGSAPQPFERFLHADYGNGVSTFRLSAEGKPLPNPRKITRALSQSNPAAQPKVTLMLVQWGQFLDHDITLTPERETDDELRAKYTEHDNIWDFDHCSYFNFYRSKQVVGCIIKCDETPGCDAFIHYPDVGCYLADCDVPIPAPTWSYPPYKGYSPNEGCDGGAIIGGQCLIISKDRLSWQGAVQSCINQNGRLAVLTNPVPFISYVKALFGQSEQFWLGGSDIANEGSWVWVNGQPLDDRFPWRHGEPNNAFSNEDCLALVGDALSDAPCDRQYLYVCEPDPVEGSSTMECCDRGQYDNSVSLGVDCIPINVTGDSFYEQNGRECLRFIRSMPTSTGCDNSPMEQINQNTAFVDGSMVYGSDAEVANFVRTGYKGLLNTTTHVGNGQPLPPRGGDSFAHQCPIESEKRCFLAGDVRVDEIPGLTAMHTTFIRLHNFIAEDLCKLNPNWCGNDEQLFQETRRIVIALIQQITYGDWLPLAVGQTLMNKYQLNTGTQGYSDTYDETVNPTIRNVFATAAFRFGHSLISEVIKTAKADINLPFPGNFFNIKLLECNVTSPSSLLKGMSRSPSAPIDAIVEPAFTNHLYADHPADDGIFYGLDLLSINIQRGRDHGIPGYTKWRNFCGLENIKEFWQLKQFMPNDLVRLFQRHYKDVSDIDLFPAGIAEYPIADGILGPTFACLIAKQFANIKHGDRFWYEREGQPKPFTTEQLSSIKSQNLVSILCRVSEHTSFRFQPNPFLVESESNHVMDCSSYDFINLQPWKEEQTGCTSPWVSIGSMEGCFLFNQDRMNWDNARSYCQRNGEDLASLDTESKRKDMIKYMESRGLRNGRSPHLGANDRSGSWRWVSGQSVTNGWRILGGEPQPDDDQGDDTCMYLYTDPYPSGRYDLLSDYKCTTERYFICEKGAATTKPTTTDKGNKAPLKPSSDCRDKYASCIGWKNKNLCSENEVLTLCPKSCGTCKEDKGNKAPLKPSSDCRDKYAGCIGWKNTNLCSENEVLTLCPKSCGTCKDDKGNKEPLKPSSDCRDKHAGCMLVGWNKTLCRENEVLTQCPKSCGTCKDGVSCPQDFTPVDTQCLQFNTEYDLGWHQAVEACNARNAELLVPSNYKELKSYVGPENRTGYFWIGASYDETKGKWFWLNGESLQFDLVKDLQHLNNYCLTYNIGVFQSIPCYLVLNYICMTTPLAIMESNTTIPPLSTTLPTTSTTEYITKTTTSTLQSTSTTETTADTASTPQSSSTTETTADTASTPQSSSTKETTADPTSTPQSSSTTAATSKVTTDTEKSVTPTPQNITTAQEKSTTKAATCLTAKYKTKTTSSTLPSTTPIQIISTTPATTTMASLKTPDIFGEGGILVNPCSFSTGQKYWPHPTNCHMFINCTPAGPKNMLCPNGTAWSTTLFFCIHKANTECGQKVPLAPPNKKDPPCQCGVANRERIIGGEKVILARKYPWLVDIKLTKLLNQHLCGGTIINDRWILTAAHCMVGEHIATVVVGEHIRNYLGDDEPCITKNYTIKQYIVHPDYYFPLNDFALLELTEPIPFGNEIRPICLPEDNSRDYAGETGTVIGWGLTSNEGAGSDILKELQVPIRANNDCKEWHNIFNTTLLPSSTLCAGGLSSGSNICRGDSGGPLFIFDKNISRYVQVGVVSFAKKNSTQPECDNPDYPGVYARVSEKLKWISKTTSNGKKCN